MHTVITTPVLCSSARHKAFPLAWVPPSVQQSDFFDAFVAPQVASFVRSGTCDAALLAYGATGSGKTHSMQGPRCVLDSGRAQGSLALQAMDGVIPRVIHQILEVPTCATRRARYHVCARRLDLSSVRCNGSSVCRPRAQGPCSL